jgi:hypothetical protein
METLLLLLLLGLVVGLFVRKKGDSFTDTLQSGCFSLFGIIVAILIISIVLLIFIFK